MGEPGASQNNLLFSQDPHKLGIIIIPILQMAKLIYRQIK